MTPRPLRLPALLLAAVAAVAAAWPAMRGPLLGAALFVIAGASLALLEDLATERGKA